MPYPDDDSCPKCGEVSGDGHAHVECPTTCDVCDYHGVFGVNGCPCCYAFEVYDALDSEECIQLAELLNNVEKS